MLNFLIYILEVSVLTSIFFLFYRYLYFKLAYFEWSRYFFYAFLIISLAIPLFPGFLDTELILIKIEDIIGVSQNESLAYVNVQNSYLNSSDSFLSGIPVIEIIFIIWLSGFIRYTFIISKSVFSVFRFINKGIKRNEEKFIIVETTSDNPAFSFFNFIFVNNKFKNLPEIEKKQITNHEKIHAKQKHTIDNIIFEVFRAVFWFNPISKHISANIKIIHEFIVDNKLTGNTNIPDYSRLILKLATHCSHAITISSFSKEEITNRIKLITFPENEKIRKIRFAGSIPVLLITVLALWIIVSTINTYLPDKSKTENELHIPFKEGSYKLISPFFENKIPGELLNGKEQNINRNEQYMISHKEVTYEVKDFSEVYAIETAVVSYIKENDIFGLKELTIKLESESGYSVEYFGLFKTTIKGSDTVNKGDVIGLTGDLRLYPSVSIKVKKDNESVNPEKLY